jgi:hypothetical protein
VNDAGTQNIICNIEYCFVYSDIPPPAAPAITISGGTLSIQLLEDDFPIAVRFADLLGPLATWKTLLVSTNGPPETVIQTNLPISTSAGFFQSFRP